MGSLADRLSETSQDSFELKPDGTRTVRAIRDRVLNYDDARDWILSSGDDPDDFTLSIKSIAYGLDMFSNSMSATPKLHRGDVPDWPVVVPGPQFVVPPVTKTPRATKWETAVLMADTQIGYRFLDDGTLE